MTMTTWWIWLLPAVPLCDVAVQSLIQRHLARYQQPMLTDAQMDEINASIEVYDFADGREVNRRWAHPNLALVRMRKTVIEMSTAFQQFEVNARKAGQIFSDKLAKGPW